MSLGINNNITALNSWRQLQKTDKRMSASMEKLSSGMQINRGADDPAGLVISEKMRAQLTGLSAAVKNSEKAVNMVSTAEASLDKVMGMLDKMRALAIDSANIGLNDDAMLQANQNELDELISSITRVATFTQFGTIKLLDGSLDGNNPAGHSAVFQVGPNENQNVPLDIPSVRAQDLSVISTGATLSYKKSDGTTANISASAIATLLDVDYAGGSFVSLASLQTRTILDPAYAGNFKNGIFMNPNTTDDPDVENPVGEASKSQGIAIAIAVIDNAIDQVSGVRGKLGAVQADNLQVQLESLQVAYENLQASESTIRDTDMSKEMANYTKYQIMLQAGTAMLAQANQIPQNLLSLLK